MSLAANATAVPFSDGNALLSSGVDRALWTIVTRHGLGVLEDRRKLLGLLRDHCAEATRDIRLLMAAFDEGAPSRLKAAGANPSELEIGRETSQISLNFGISADLARQAVLTWANALALYAFSRDAAALPPVERLVAPRAAALSVRHRPAWPRWLKIVLAVGVIGMLVVARLVQLDADSRTVPTPAVKPVPHSSTGGEKHK